MYQGLLKLSTARNAEVLMIDSSDHITGKAGLTLTITASKDGAAFASVTPTVTDLGSGVYNLALTTTHTNTLGDLVLHITGTAADPSDYKFQVVTELPGVVLGDTSGTTTLLSRITVAPPTAVQVRTEMDSNSTKLANLDAAISSRSTYAGGAVASVTAGVTVTTNSDKTGYALTAGEHTNITADVNTALDAAGTELSSLPSVTSSLRSKLNFLFQYFSGKRTITSSVETLYKNDGSTTLGTSALSDDGTTVNIAKKV